jgi:hypothetical protein
MNGIRIRSRHAGGNIRLLAEKGGEIHLEQDLRDTAQWWFYWNFRADSERAQTIEFVFRNGEVIGPWGPAVSGDGITWRWLGAASIVAPDRFRYTFEAGETRYFCFSIPYQLHHYERFCTGIGGYPHVRREVLTVSEQLRPVPKLLVGNPEASGHVLLTCRHHACESTASYVLEGLIEALLRANSPVLHTHLLHVIPFVDLDGVENGDQGKNRRPHDHNRDYTEAPIYRETKAIMDEAAGLENFAAGIDFHCPFKWGGRNDVPFIVKKGPPAKEENERFGALLEEASLKAGNPCPVKYRSEHDIETGEDWNQPHGTNCSAFFEKQRARLALSFEFPYFGTDPSMITQQHCRQFGAVFAAALERYLLG